MDDPPRLLHRRSEVGYTEQPALALQNEPEAVPAHIQERQASEANQRDREAARAAWGHHRRELLALLGVVDAQPWASGLRADLRSIRSYIERIDRRLK